MRAAMQLVLHAVIDLEASQVIAPPRYEGSHAPTTPWQRQPVPAVVDQGRRRGAGHPQAALGQLLPRRARAPAGASNGPRGR